MKKEEQRRRSYAEFYNNYEIKRHHILYEVFYGRGMLDNPYGIFKAWMQRNDFDQYEHFWAIKNWKENERLMDIYKEYENVHFVRYMSEEYLYHTATAAYLINNLAFPSFYTPRKGQIYLNTWHTASTDPVGLDAENGNVEARNLLRNFLAADYLLESGKHMKEIYDRSFQLKGIFEGIRLKEGQPRSDILWKGDEKGKIEEKLEAYDIKLSSDKKIILYLFHGAEETESIGGKELNKRRKCLERQIDANQYQILLKCDDVLHDRVDDAELLKGCLVPGVIDLDEIFSLTDIFIIDDVAYHSSFLPGDRPVFFYDGLKTQQNSCRQQKFKIGKRKRGDSGKRILEILLDGKKRPGMLKDRWKQHFHHHRKEKILFYGSDLRENGVTYSLLSLLDRIDHKKYDVTLLLVLNREGSNREKICEIDPRIRVITKIGVPNGTEKEIEAYQKALDQGIDGISQERGILKKYLFKEFQRMFGNAKFDHIIEFTGYSPLYGMVFAAADTGKKYIWQHSDLYRESQKMMKNGTSLQKTLGTVFSLYPYYDKIVACSKAVRDLNRKHLANEATEGKFTYVRNTFSASRVIQNMKEKYETIEEYKNFPRPSEKDMVYVTMGRLSPEKNQKNLIKAFQMLHQELKDTKLYIIGDGPLKEELGELIKQYGLEKDVIMTGNLKNPFALMKRCGCFVLPSNYEGQPMSVLEVRVLGLPIILSDFRTRKDVCMPGGQWIVKKDPDSICQGMKEAYRSQGKQYEFEAEKYNQEAYQEFEGLLEI